LGQVGLPTAIYIKNRGFKVQGYDISKVNIEKARKRGIFATKRWSEISADIYVISVSTGLKNNEPDMSEVYQVCQLIKKKKTPSLISVESTVTVGTCRKIHHQIFNKKVSLVHVPHRYWKEDPINHGVNQFRVIGAVDKESLDAGLDFYKEKLEIPLHIASSIEVTEICKIVENSYRYIQISCAEELRMICEELGLNFNEVRKASNTKWNIEIMEAREGIKGHCLPKDIWYLMSLVPSSFILKGAISTDQKYQGWLKKRDGK
jgi:UDP-N-acetyl-D-mannosaminuronic acid dehydrogenase